MRLTIWLEKTPREPEREDDIWNKILVLAGVDKSLHKLQKHNAHFF